MEVDIGAEADFPEGMSAVEIGDRPILVTRLNGVCHAVGNICPHAGAKLNEGTLRQEFVVCPWHKAEFSVITGRTTEPPAVDDLPRYQLRVANGRLLLDDAPPSQPLQAPSDPDRRCFAIIGAGAAGAEAARTLRQAGFSGRLVLIGRERDPRDPAQTMLPYDRTILSKYTLSGRQGGEKTPLQDSAFYQRQNIERRAGEVRSIDPAKNLLRFSDGSELAYDMALLATGGTPRRADLPGANLPGVFVLRSAADAAAIVAAAENARNVIVLGAGFIAMEAAASLRERGLQVTVVAQDQEPFERNFGAEIGRVFRDLHEHEGVVFRLGETLAAIEGDGRAEHVRLQSGARLAADIVLLGGGISPSTTMLPAAYLREDGGVTVESRLRVTDRLYAAGDVASFPLYGTGGSIRVEHWRVAQQHGRVAARNMLGQDIAFDRVPYFWTIHFMKRLDYVGHAPTWDDLVIDGDLRKPQFLAYYGVAGRVAAIAGWDQDKKMAAAIGLMQQRQDWTVAALRAALATVT
jgi:NADPH-dependent 2,4-dienoyl-CoA reductase/sulfur reductase-like enzyme/nitrite reductase/ring-hydroxylating ferredoxin subunit